MEGISHEAASLAGTWGLGKLVCFWDDNHISIDGNTDGWFTDNTPERFEAYGWNVVRGVDGHDADSIKAAIDGALAQFDKPTLICCRTTIGFVRRARPARNPATARRWARTNWRPPASSWAGTTVRSKSPKRSTPAGVPAVPAPCARPNGNSSSTSTPRISRPKPMN